MNEFKTFDNGIELSYSNFNHDKDGDAYIIVRAERWNYSYNRYEGLDYEIPTGKVRNIDNLKEHEVKTFVNLVREYEKEIVKSAKEFSFVDEGDNMIELDVKEPSLEGNENNIKEPSSEENDAKESSLEENENEIKESSSEENTKEPNKILSKLKKIFS